MGSSGRLQEPVIGSLLGIQRSSADALGVLQMWETVPTEIIALGELQVSSDISTIYFARAIVRSRMEKLADALHDAKMASSIEGYIVKRALFYVVKGTMKRSKARAGVGSWDESLEDAGAGGLWNTRAWTLQEFFASRVIRFYTEDWKLYLPLETVYNHKHSQLLLSLRPGSENVRQNLRLAATRIAKKQEDIAYSLFGIFDVSIPVTYGEGPQRALGRLLQEILTRSGEVTILAWTGKASDYNSCLPVEISVYREPVSHYVPSQIEDGEMDAVVRTSSGHLDSAMVLYDRVVLLPSPRLVSRRLSLSCIMFPLRGPLVSSGDSARRVYRTMTSALGNVEIKTTTDLSSLNNLVLVHPWLQCLLDPALPFEDLIVDDDDEPLTPLDGGGGNGDSDALFTDALSPSSSYTASASAPTNSSQLDKLTRSLRLFVGLKQPFGVLLLAPLSYNEYKHVASDHPIVVQLLRLTALSCAEGTDARYLVVAALVGVCLA
ncbi:hypothetical protein OG21DRAFT_1487449 [Imleria badia]|nr:hypothetical protein OG21DRAFT_1487449 [Imleria badia]